MINDFKRKLLSQKHVSLYTRSNSTCSRFKGKVAIITASTSGIGYAIAKRLGEEGANIVVSSRREENVEKATKSLKDLGFNVLGLTCHVSNKENREKLIEKTLDAFGGIDILIANAGVNAHRDELLTCSESAWEKTFEINVKNTFQLTQEVVPHMKRRKGGSVLYNSSISAFSSYDLTGVYGVAKTSLLGLTKAVAKEVASDNIRVNCIASGPVDTNFFNQVGLPEEIAEIAAFLCSEDASFITGETIVAAGGMQSRL